MKQSARTPIVIVLDRLRSAHNTGNIFRLADAVNAAEIITCGYTPSPPHPKLEKTAMGADKLVPCRSFPSSYDAVTALRSEGWVKQIVAVETGRPSSCAWEFGYEYPVALIFGNEALGIEDRTISVCNGIVSLPMLGGKESVNVGNCAAVVLYAALAAFRSGRK